MHNDDKDGLQNMYKSPDILTEMRIRIMEWLEHIIRMEATRIPEMIRYSKPEGKRGVGRSELRCLDDADADIKSPVIKKLRLKDQDRKECTIIQREAKAKLKWL
jgi:hypothetical protein